MSSADEFLTGALEYDAIFDVMGLNDEGYDLLNDTGQSNVAQVLYDGRNYEDSPIEEGAETFRQTFDEAVQDEFDAGNVE